MMKEYNWISTSRNCHLKFSYFNQETVVFFIRKSHTDYPSDIMQKSVKSTTEIVLLF